MPAPSFLSNRRRGRPCGRRPPPGRLRMPAPETNRLPFLELGNTARGMGASFCAPREGAERRGEGGRDARRSSDGGRSARRTGASAGARRARAPPEPSSAPAPFPAGCFSGLCDLGAFPAASGRCVTFMRTERAKAAGSPYRTARFSQTGAQNAPSQPLSRRPAHNAPFQPAPMHRPPRSSRTQARGAARAQCAHRTRRPASRRAGVAPYAAGGTA